MTSEDQPSVDTPLLATSDQAERISNTAVQEDAVRNGVTDGDERRRKRLIQKLEHGYTATKIRSGLAGFFEECKIPSETQDRLVALLLIRAEAKTKVNKDYLAGRFPSREAAKQWYESICNKSLEETTKLLPNGKLDDYVKAVGKVNIRDNLTVADFALAQANVPLSSQQRESYVEAVYKNYMSSDVDPHFTLSLPHSSLEVQTYVVLRAAADARALREVSGQLTGEQIDIIRTYQNNQIKGIVNRWNSTASKARSNSTPQQ